MGLTLKQLRALKEIPTARSWAEVARRAGVSESALRKWLREDPDFRAAVQERIALALLEFQHGLYDAARQAIRTLVAAMDMGQKVPWGVRVKAAEIAVEAAIAVAGLARERAEVDIGDELAAFLRDLAQRDGGSGAGGEEPRGAGPDAGD